MLGGRRHQLSAVSGSLYRMLFSPLVRTNLLSQVDHLTHRVRVSRCCCGACREGFAAAQEDAAEQERGSQLDQGLLAPTRREQQIDLHENPSFAQQELVPTRTLDASVMTLQEQRQVQPAPAATPAPRQTMPSSLPEALSELGLLQYEEALRELGCADTYHLCDLEEADMVEIGMKKLEVKRLLRMVAEYNAVGAVQFV